MGAKTLPLDPGLHSFPQGFGSMGGGASSKSQTSELASRKRARCRRRGVLGEAILPRHDDSPQRQQPRWAAVITCVSPRIVTQRSALMRERHLELFLAKRE